VRKAQIFGLVFILIITLTTITVVYAKDKKEISTLASYKKDITGDHQQDRIEVKGITVGEKFKNVEIDIITSKDKKYNIPLTGNQKPKVFFKDLNQDGLKDLLVSSTPYEENETNFHLYSFKDDQFTNIGLPDPLSLTAQLENNYQASIVIDKTGNEYAIDLKNKRKSFERSGLYQNGRLNEPTELIVKSFEQITPVRLRDMKVGLKTSQLIGEGYTGDSIAKVVSTWKWSNGRWELLKTGIKKIDKK
jgi:hypothetical protein